MTHLILTFVLSFYKQVGLEVFCIELLFVEDYPPGTINLGNDEQLENSSMQENSTCDSLDGFAANGETVTINGENLTSYQRF